MCYRVTHHQDDEAAFDDLPSSFVVEYGMVLFGASMRPSCVHLDPNRGTLAAVDAPYVACAFCLLKCVDSCRLDL